MGYCPFEHKAGLGTALGAQAGAGAGWACGRTWGAQVTGERWHWRKRAALGPAMTRRRGARAQAAGARSVGSWAARARRRQARQGPRPARAFGPVGCALCALSLFLARFDSVWFLSRFLDIVRELGS